MMRFLRKIPGGRIAILGLYEENYDKVLTPGYVEPEEKPLGFAGIRKVFTPNEYGQLSSELVTTVHMCSCSLIFGAILGACAKSKETYYNFLENNQATKFANHFDAKRQLHLEITMAVAKGGFYWGWRIAAFSSLLIVSNTMLAAYTGRYGWPEYIGAGAVAGGFYKMNLGMKAVIAGSVVGSILGAVAGAVSMLAMSIFGITMQDIQKNQYKLHQIRNEAKYSSAAKEQSESVMEVFNSELSSVTKT